MDGVQSSSQNGSSGVAPTRTFDVSVETEVLQLLNFIRRGPFSPEEKNTYRDTVLDFAAEKNTASLQTLSETLMQHGVELTSGGQPLPGSLPVSTEHTTEPVAEVNDVPQAPETSMPTEPQAIESTPTANSFGGSRPKPQFGVAAEFPESEAISPTAPETVIDTPDPVVVEETPIAPHHPDMGKPATPPEPPLDLPTIGTPTATKEQPVPVSVPDPEPQAVDPVASSMVSEQEAAPAATETIAKAKPEPEEQGGAPSPVKPPIERIKEIKRRVNDAVGNPVHLIDADNDIGREYMNALLNAMKQVSDGSGADMEHAMDRLEKAYESVMRLLVEHPIGQQQPAKTNEDSVPLAEAVGQAAPTTEAIPQPEQSQLNQAPPAPAKAPVAQVPESSVSVPNTPDPSTPQVKMEIESVQAEENTVQDVPLTTPSEPAVPQPPQAAAEAVMPAAPAPAQEPAPDPAPASSPVPETPQSAGIPEKVSPVAAPTPGVPEQPQSLAAQLEEKRNAQDTLTQENLVKQQSNAASTDPLLAPEVSSGLHQLLAEWKLFKSSGFLGTGPSGYEHPLYKQISAMPMNAVVAGRFDGATPEIRQSISDYMNGWYYEQNVAHDMNETFEHYLRRVVRRILEKQKAVASAKSAVGA